MQLRPLFVHLIKELEENQQWENRKKKKKSLSLRGDSLFGCAEDDCGQALSAAACVSYPKLPICWLLVSCLEVFPAQRQTSPYHVIPFIPTSKTVSVLVESDFPQSFHSDERERENLQPPQYSQPLVLASCSKSCPIQSAYYWNKISTSFYHSLCSSSV